MSIAFRELNAKFSGRSTDPKHHVNALDSDWQAGYLLGCHTQKETFDEIHIEWLLRGKPTLEDHTWISLKRGLWAGKFMAIPDQNTH